MRDAKAGTQARVSDRDHDLSVLDLDGNRAFSISADHSERIAAAFCFRANNAGRGRGGPLEKLATVTIVHVPIRGLQNHSGQRR
ncbi:hypothetical protein KQX62_03945 [Rhodopseudomonas palustris]|uniref:Uncharacterized protein n=1 Tax=Rhodopseudomonas palustris TaxID=1076 RepID=A0AAX3E1U9_RHOPL|nr:hypothetical protein [Rhodopseudomonas palustris]UYO40476.1 hypothetical protein KQX62_03945 [Rhodopseudomonas palustris]